MYYTRNTELYHYGILGQKWGVRRYQNEDGTYTEAGKRRRAQELAKTLSKKKYSRGMALKDKYQNKTLEPVLEAIPKKAIKNVSEARDKMLQVIKKNSYDADAFDDEVYSLLEKNSDYYNKKAKSKFKKSEGYDPGDTDLWTWEYDLAEQDVLKKHPDIQKKENETLNAINEYQAYCKKVSDSILGEYGELKIPSNNSWDKSTVNDAISDCFLLIDTYPEVREYLLSKE